MTPAQLGPRFPNKLTKFKHDSPLVESEQNDLAMMQAELAQCSLAG